MTVFEAEVKFPTIHLHLVSTVIDVVWLYIGKVVDQVIPPSVEYSMTVLVKQLVVGAEKEPPLGEVCPATQVLLVTTIGGATRTGKPVLQDVPQTPGTVVTIFETEVKFPTIHLHLVSTVIDVVWLYIGKVVDQVIPPSVEYSMTVLVKQLVVGAEKEPPIGVVCPVAQVLFVTPIGGATRDGKPLHEVAQVPGTEVTDAVILDTVLSTSQLHLVRIVIAVVWLYVGMVIDHVVPLLDEYCNVDPDGHPVDGAEKLPPVGTVPP